MLMAYQYKLALKGLKCCNPSCNQVAAYGDWFCGIEWNHAVSYGGRRQNEPWGIIPMCHLHHEQESRHRPLISRAMRDRIFAFGMLDDFKAKYPKSTLL